MPFPDKTHQFQSGAQAVEMGRKGGSAKSPAKTLANTLKNLERNKRIDPEMKQWLYEMMTDNELSAFHVLQFITKCQGPKDTTKDKRELAKLLLDWKKMQHGTKETHSKVDVTSREYKVVVEVSAKPEEVKEIAGDQVQFNKETVISVPVLDR